MNCPDCGDPMASTSIRCRPCTYARQRQEAAHEAAQEDAVVLDMAASGMSMRRMGRALGIGQMNAWRKVQRAKRRTALLRSLVR